MRTLPLLLLLLACSAWPQVLTDPRDMALPDTGFSRPDPTDYELVLENGLHAYIARADQVPLVTMSAFVRAGKVNDTAPGAAEALADALQRGGTADMNAGEFAETLRLMTADFVVEMHDEWTEVSLNVPTEDFDQALALFSEVLRNPQISGTNIERAGAGAGAESADLGGESGAALYEGSMNDAVAHLRDIVYEGHAFADHPGPGDFERLGPSDVASFHRRYFVPGNTTIAVAGRVDVDTVNTRLADQLSDWEAAPVPPVEQQTAIKLKRRALHHYPARKLQSWLVIGHALPDLPLEDRAAFDVMTYIVGAYHLNTRLMRETRYKYGYTNDASAFVDEQWFGPGIYSFRSYSRPEVIKSIYQNMMGELERTRREEVSDREMFVAKGALTDGLFPVRYLDGYTLTRSLALEKLRYGNHQRSASYVDRVRKVTKRDVLNVAQKYLQLENMQIVLVGEEAFAIE